MEIIERTNDQNTEYAGFWLRFVAYLIDKALLSVIGFIIVIPFISVIIAFAIGLSKIKGPEDFFSDGNLLKAGATLGLIFMLILLSFISSWLYYALMESSKHGGTLGKLAVGIVVTDYEGQRVTFARATGRYFARIITNFTFYIGYIIAGFTDKKQALHDIISSCLIVRKSNSAF